MSESQPFPQPEGERAAGSRRTPWIVAAVAVVILSVLLWDSRETASTVGVEETTGADGTAGRAVTIDPPLGPEVRREVIVLATLGGLPSVPKGAIVEAAGLVVDIVDRPGVPFRVTLADRTGIAEVVSFAASDELKARIRGAECLRLDAQVDTYRGDFQLEPVAFSLIRTGTAAELGFDPGLRPAPVERYSDLAEGKVVAFDARVLSVLPTRGGGSMHGELEFPAGDRIRYLWSDPPDGLGAAELVTAVARVGSYENRLQVRPFTGSARLATATAGPTPAGPAAPLGIVEAMAAAEGAIVRTRGLVADVIESERIPFMVLLADARGSVKLVISGAPEPLRTRLREAMSEGGAVALEARINTYRNEKQLQPTDAEALEFLPAGAVEPPAPIARTSDLEVGQVVRFEGLIGDTRRNRAGGLNGSVSLGSGRSMDFIWWSPPGWAERGVRIGGFARVGEFREAMQLEMTGSVRRLEP